MLLAWRAKALPSVKTLPPTLCHPPVGLPTRVDGAFHPLPLWCFTFTQPPGYLQVHSGAVYVTRDQALLGALGLCLLRQ